jgi:hypothetical protein
MQITTKALLLLAASMAAATASTNHHESHRQPHQPGHKHSSRSHIVSANETAALVNTNLSDSSVCIYVFSLITPPSSPAQATTFHVLRRH